jgi:N-methylhydantoinase B
MSRAGIDASLGSPSAAPRTAIDPILLEVLRNRLDAIADEMELTLLKSAASPIVKEGLDASAALFNIHGETIAQAAAIPIHLGALQFAAQRIVRAFPPELMRDGDTFLLNDPYDGGTHLPDITMAVPVFADGRAVALACTMCHHQDVGGRTPGSVPTDATELYQEGVIIPPTQLFRAGELDENLFRFLIRNVRLPGVFSGDLMAQVAAGRLGALRLRELFATHGTPTVLECVEELLTRAETLTRRQIEAMPDGEYRFEDYLDNDGVELDRRVKIAVTVRVHGSDMTFDFTGTDAQVRGPFNSVPASTLSAVFYVIRAISDPSIPNNGGCFRAVDAILPEGSVVNPRPQAPVSCRTATIKRIADTILGALVRALPHAGRELGYAAGHGARRHRARHRPALRGERAGSGWHGRAPAQGRHRCHRDRCLELHEHPGGVGRDGLPAADRARQPVDGLGWRGTAAGWPGPREGVRGHHD